MICQHQAAVINAISHLSSVTVSSMVRYSLERRVFLYDTYVKYDLLENVDVNFVMKKLPADKQFTIWLIKLRTTGLLIDKKQKHKR
jgi:hypothetical protein